MGPDAFEQCSTCADLEDRWRPALVRWPTERARLAGLRSVGLPVLLLVEEGCVPPSIGVGEDFAMGSAQPGDVRSRVRNLATRFYGSVRLDGEVLTTLSGRVQLSPSQAVLIGALLEGPQRRASRAQLRAAIGVGDGSAERRLQDALGRLRRRIRPVGLTVRTEPWQRVALAVGEGDVDEVVTA